MLFHLLTRVSVTDMRTTCQQLVAEHWTKINKDESSTPGLFILLDISSVSAGIE